MEIKGRVRCLFEQSDTFKKPTAYWFFNCEPTYFLSECKKEAKIVFNA